MRSTKIRFFKYCHQTHVIIGSKEFKLVKNFSSVSKLNQGLVYSLRTTTNQTLLRLTFFPDSTIERLKSYNEDEKNRAIDMQLNIQLELWVDKN